jgi:hypothetical protein
MTATNRNKPVVKRPESERVSEQDRKLNKAMNNVCRGC